MIPIGLKNELKKERGFNLKYTVMSKDLKAKVKATGKTIMVYRSKIRNTYISSEDFETEYKAEELTML